MCISKGCVWPIEASLSGRMAITQNIAGTHWDLCTNSCICMTQSRTALQLLKTNSLTVLSFSRSLWKNLKPADTSSHTVSYEDTSLVSQSSCCLTFQVAAQRLFVILTVFLNYCILSQYSRTTFSFLLYIYLPSYLHYGKEFKELELLVKVWVTGHENNFLKQVWL